MAACAVAGLLLAAGGGRRFGMPKALVPWGPGLLVEHAATTLADAGCDPVITVLGAAADEVRARSKLPGVVIDNPDWADGMGSSLRVGLGALGDSDAVIVLTVDTPGITADAIRRLVAIAAPDALARATYDGVPGHPVLLGRDHWRGVAEAADGDTGARPYLARHRVTDVPCADIADGADADRPEDLPGRPHDQ
ncbi:nicotine blue oxidoreductase [Actinokineospora alba]|uniref:Nicotine blue oxidoreductase n=1 Tax=Actinokineospora alba TaxID=504798 RepID=A0A1H0V0G9_9PSEU|nr:nucleotidyltransferase family protein [Actinokineospora alba]TDP68947.1 nicotine blue oxidoreductase [Actinokineospora alba]SDI75886.1 nicotine blue oxidoreductase [Actinokineospora alba]SDP71833.1 nicotine blue oxidoreductase [Actinokineospora alba]